MAGIAIILVATLIAGAIHLLLMPYVLQLVLTGFGYDVSFLFSLGVWVLVTVVLSMIGSAFKR